MSDSHVVSTDRQPPLVPPVRGRRDGRWRTSLIVMASLTLLATGGVVVGSASAAQAMPSSCSIVNGGTYAESLCTSGLGEHRVIMTQQHFMPGAGPIVCEGPWAPVGSVSRTTCAPHTVISVRVETREPGAPSMGGTPTPPPTEPPPPPGGLDCRTVGNAMQTYIEPYHFKAMWFAFNMEYCYNSVRDLVRVTPRIFPPLIQLPAEEVAHGFLIGSIGTMRINSIVSGFPVITESGSPVRTSQGQVYSGVYTVNASFTPNNGMAIPRTQTAQASIGVIINSDRAFPTPPVFIRLT